MESPPQQQHSSSTSSTPPTSRPNPRAIAGARKLQRQRSRLQMHAPASITVGPVEPASISNWKIPIPLLSPLDVSPVDNNIVYVSENETEAAVGIGTSTAASASTSAVAVASSSSSSSSSLMWRHPAEPFYYEPLPGRAPGFAFSNCT